MRQLRHPFDVEFVVENLLEWAKRRIRHKEQPRYFNPIPFPGIAPLYAFLRNEEVSIELMVRDRTQCRNQAVGVRMSTRSQSAQAAQALSGATNTNYGGQSKLVRLVNDALLK